MFNYIISHVFPSFRPLTFTLKSVLSLDGHNCLIATDKFNPYCYYFTRPIGLYMDNCLSTTGKM